MDAIDNLGDAIDVTRDRLTPIDLGTWLKLAIVIFFVGGLTVGGTGFPVGDVGGIGAETDEDISFGDLEAEWEAEFGDDLSFEEFLIGLAFLAGILFLLWLLYALIGAIMEFVFIESLRNDEVRLRRYANGNVGQGIRLLAFRLALLVAVSVPVLVPIWWVVTSADGISPALAVAGLLYGLAILGLGLVYVIVNRFTTVFVTQVMVGQGVGVLAGWRRFWSTLRANLGEYVVYLLLIWILQFVVNIGFGVLAGITAIVVAIPFIVLAVIFALFGGAGVALAVLVGFVGLLTVFLAVLLIRVPVDAYFRYYEFLLLGDTDAELDLIPSRRVAAASGDDGIGDAPADDPSKAWTEGTDGAWGGESEDDHGGSPTDGTDTNDGASSGDDWDTSSEWSLEDDDRDAVDDEEDDDGRSW